MSEIQCSENAVTPPAPSAGLSSIYAKADGKWYQQNSAGVETLLGNGVGGGGGDMLKATYDPTNVNGDAFDMDQMVEGVINLILTATERTAIATNTVHTNSVHAPSNAQANAPTASQGEAEGGIDNTKMMTSLRVAQAIAVLAAGIKNNYTAITGPALADDTAAGYSAGSVWINTVLDEAYRCVDPSAGAAVWVNTTLTAAELAAVALSGNSDDLTEGATNLLLTIAERTNIANNTIHAASAHAPAGATVNSTDATLLNRANHTGTQLLATVSDAGTSASLNVPATGDAAAGEVVKGSDTRLTDARTPTTHTHGITTGGTGQTTAQAAIDALSNVAAATNEHVLTKDTATGNAVFKAVPVTGGGASLSVANTWTAAQRVTPVALTDAATIAVDASLSNNFTVTLAGNRTLGNPTNLVAGQGGSIKITQDATGSRTLAYSSYWKFEGGTAPTLTTTANAVDRLDYFVWSATEIHAALATDVK